VKEKDTIVSIATPMGTGALSIIRCSGDEVSKIIDIFLKKKLSPRHAHYINFKNKDNIVVDDIIAIFYDSPKSYTGENMLEIICHGGPVIYQLIIDEILKLEDCRLAKAGEFSERAFLNNKISITQAESISALINAKTKEAAIAARESMSGKITQDIQKIDSSILNARVQVEALLDFSEEDIETEGLVKIGNQLKKCKDEILGITDKLEKNRLLFETSKITVLGKPNTGKSSLINYLADDDVSIVNNEAGTTRDVVSKLLNFSGVPVTIYDTAGIRETSDCIEKEGKEKAFKQAHSSDMILYLYDAQIGIDKDDLEILDTLKITNPNILVIANKIDQVEKKNLENIFRYQSNDLFISILDERNIIELKESIISYLKKSIKNSSPGLYNIENVKHLNRAFKEINQINLSLGELEIAAEYLKKAQKYISMVLDNDNDDRVLSGIFSNFCIGK
jgi:tRNA modification GTPase